MGAPQQAMSRPTFRYLSAWFCPFAHRATLALEHHRGRVDYEWVEALGWFQQDDLHNVTGTGKEWIYHKKSEELKRVNPSALVPTLIPMVNGEPMEAQAVWESLIAIDYIDQVANAQDLTQRLVIQNDPYQAARCRLWADKVNRECCSPYYGVLVRQDATERRDHFAQLLRGLENFSTELRRTSGPLFLADGQLSNVDLALLPWAYRYYVLEHYRGPDFAIPRQRESLAPYFAWYEHLLTLECVQRTLPDPDRYLDHIQKYADGTARSKVANAVRRGVAAHEFDDDKDNY